MLVMSLDAFSSVSCAARANLGWVPMGGVDAAFWIERGASLVPPFARQVREGAPLSAYPFWQAWSRPPNPAFKGAQPEG